MKKMLTDKMARWQNAKADVKKELEEKGYSKVARAGVRGGFSMIELIFVLLILGIILVFMYAKLSGGFSRTQADTVFSNEVDNIVRGALNYKNSSPNSGDTFSGLNGDEIVKYIISDKITADTTTTPHSIKSAKFPGCNYYVAPFASNQQFKLLVDCSAEKASQNWDNRKTQLFEEKIVKFVKDRSTTAATEDYAATAIGNANAALTGGGTTTDGIVGITAIGG